MKGYDLIKGMGHLEEEIIEEALTADAAAEPQTVRQPKRFLQLSRMRWVAAAACIAVAVFAGWGLTNGGRMGTADAPVYMSDSAKNAMDEEVAYGAVEEAAPEAAETEETDIADESTAVETAGIEATAEMDVPAEPAESAPMAAEPEEELDAVTEMIESFPGDYREACYAVPKNGEVGDSMPLQDAMAVYDNAVTYRVYADIFRDEELLDPAGKETAQLLDMLFRNYAITTALEKVTGPDGKKAVYPTLHATFEQLRRFAGDEEHGWMLYLYDERVETPDE